MYQRNLSPEFSEEGKSWTLQKVLKTDTGVVPWLISIEGEYFVALSVPAGSRTSYRCNFYPSNSKGSYSNSPYNRIAEVNLYVDLEAACDEFAKIVYERKLINAELDDEMRILEELQEEENKKS